MSANMVGEIHIDALITAGLQVQRWAGESEMYWYHPGADGHMKQHRLNDGTASAVGAMLLAENQRSVNYRYSEDEAAPAYTYRPMPGEANPVDILKAIQGFEYQSCETPDWYESVAHSFCQALRHRMISRLPGYRDSGAWEITSRNFFRDSKTCVSP